MQSRSYGGDRSPTASASCQGDMKTHHWDEEKTDIVTHICEKQRSKRSSRLSGSTLILLILEDIHCKDITVIVTCFRTFWYFTEPYELLYFRIQLQNVC